MKKLLTIAGIILLAQFAQARPAYTNGQYYVWSADKASVATNALNYINGSGWFPMTGRNAKTGELEPNKAKTTKWADGLLVLNDGRVCFPRISEAILDALGIAESDRELFWTSFQPSVVVVTSDMLPVEE